MTKDKPDPEEQRLKARRRLMKLGAYSLPAIATILATEEAYSQAIKFARRPGKLKNRKQGFS